MNFVKDRLCQSDTGIYGVNPKPLSSKQGKIIAGIKEFIQNAIRYSVNGQSAITVPCCEPILPPEKRLVTK